MQNKISNKLRLLIHAVFGGAIGFFASVSISWFITVPYIAFQYPMLFVLNLLSGSLQLSWLLSLESYSTEIS